MFPWTVTTRSVLTRKKLISILLMQPVYWVVVRIPGMAISSKKMISAGKLHQCFSLVFWIRTKSVLNHRTQWFYKSRAIVFTWHITNRFVFFFIIRFKKQIVVPLKPFNVKQSLKKILVWQVFGIELVLKTSWWFIFESNHDLREEFHKIEVVNSLHLTI